VRKGKEIFKKGSPIENVFYMVRGKIMICDEKYLNLASTFYNGLINRSSAYFVFFRGQPKKNPTKGFVSKQERLIPLVNPNSFMSLSSILKLKRQTLFEEEEAMTPRKTKVTIEKNYTIKIRKKVNQIEYPELIGSTDILEGKTSYKYTGITKIPTYIIQIPLEIYELLIKDNSRNYLEKKTEFIYNSIPKAKQSFSYESVK
jgi:hypothetical protein